jgi:predicted TPR repeat methyltransferase
MQTVQDDKAFYFYTKIGCPTGLKANSLREFSDMLKRVEAASVAFHSARGDFEKWLMMMQDRTLASKFVAARKEKLSPVALKSKLIKAVDLRLKHLK